MGMNIFQKLVVVGNLSLCVAGSLYSPAETPAQGQQIVWTNQEKPILEEIRTLRKLSEGNRAKTTKQLALRIRQLPA